MFDFYDWKKLFGIGANEVKKDCKMITKQSFTL